MSLPSLTPREAEVLALLCGGTINNAEIAARLSIGTTTVHFHMTNLLTKLESSSRAELIARAFNIGLAQPPASGEDAA